MSTTSKLLGSIRGATNELVDALFQEANEETQAARLKDAKARVVSKMKQLQAAKLVVANIEREIEDLKIELRDTL